MYYKKQINKFINFIINLFIKSKYIEPKQIENIKLVRFYDDGKTSLGKLYIDNKLYYTCELSWNNNEKKNSCIPCGVYDIELYNIKKFGKCILIKGVPNRSGILIHQGNTYKDTSGCILVGKEIREKIFIKNNYYIGVINSKKAKKEILELAKEKTKIEITLVRKQAFIINK